MLKAVLFLAVLVCAVSTQQLSWTGEWTFECEAGEDYFCYGGLMYTCANGTHVYGVYSDIGFFEGSIDHDKVSGNWYEAGFTDKVAGGFTLQLKENGEEIAGNWWYDNYDCVPFVRNARRSADTPTDTQCLEPATWSSNTLAGHWQKGVQNHGLDDVYICIENGYYYSSAFINVQGVQSYAVGRIVDTEMQRAQGSYYSTEGDDLTMYQTQGIHFMKLVGADTMAVIATQGVESALDVNPSDYVYKGGEADYFTRIGTASDSQCRQYMSLQPNVWQGSWTNTMLGDGLFYTCVNGTSLTGILSQYAWLEGTIDQTGMTATGSIVYSGMGTGTTANFSITLNDLYTSFSGWIMMDGASSQQSWSEDRVDVSDDAVRYCWDLEMSRNTIEGNWVLNTATGETIDFCIESDGSVQASWEYNGVAGYLEGTAYNNGKAIQLMYYDTEQYYPVITGVGIARLTEDESLVLSLWDDPVPSQPFEPCLNRGAQNSYYFDEHFVVSLERASSGGACDRNSWIRDGDYYISPSSASVLSIASLLSFIPLLALFL